MLEPVSATTIIMSFLIVFAIVIPILGVIPKIKETISLRYLIVVVFLACMIGVVINYKDLDVDIKKAVVIGAAILSGAFILVRSVEKWFFNGFISGRRIEAQVKKGDAEARIILDEKKSKTTLDDKEGLKALARREQQ